jgi:hypothetical protein
VNALYKGYSSPDAVLFSNREKKCIISAFGDESRRLLTVSQRFAKHCNCRLQGGYHIHPENVNYSVCRNFVKLSAIYAAHSSSEQTKGGDGGGKKCATNARHEFLTEIGAK